MPGQPLVVIAICAAPSGFGRGRHFTQAATAPVATTARPVKTGAMPARRDGANTESTPIIPPKEHPMATLGVNITYSNYRMNENDRTVTATITFNQPIRPDSFNLPSLYNIEGYRARFTPSNLTAVAGSNNTQWTVTLTPDAGIDGQYGKI